MSGQEVFFAYRAEELAGTASALASAMKVAPPSPVPLSLELIFWSNFRTVDDKGWASILVPKEYIGLEAQYHNAKTSAELTN